MGLDLEPKRLAYRSLSDPATLQNFARNLGEGIYITSEAGEFLDANPAMLEICGVRSLDELREYRVPDLLEPEARTRGVELMRRHGAIRDFELRIKRPDGGVRTVLDTAYVCVDPETNERFYHGILVDITRRKELEEQLVEMSIRDPLTGCYNRRYLSELERGLDSGKELWWGCIFIDLDNFKGYNDTNGHSAGDSALVRMSRFLMRNVRAEEAVVRVGGDEFLIVLTGADEATTQNIAKRLSESAADSAPVPFSLGCAARQDSEKFRETMNRADQKLLEVRVETRKEKNSRRVS